MYGGSASRSYRQGEPHSLVDCRLTTPEAGKFWGNAVFCVIVDDTSRACSQSQRYDLFLY